MAMKSPARVILGIVLIGFFAAWYAFEKHTQNQQMSAIADAKRFNGSPDSAAPGDQVIIEGTVSERNPLLVHDFVAAEKQYYKSGRGSGWEILDTYNQPVVTELARGEVILRSDSICTDSKKKNFLETDEKTGNGNEIRYQGVRRLDPITAGGVIEKMDPPVIAVRYCYLGSINEYQDSIKGDITFNMIACLGSSAVGVVLILSGIGKRKP
jgi:hypothetical protein